MKIKCAMVAAVLATSITSAFAIAEDAYFIVRTPSTNKCTVKRPANTPNLIVGDAYKTKTDAQAAMKKLCAAN
jgi:hypothetical protein